jgi:transcriptional regulator GlxA family with amidase domain
MAQAMLEMHAVSGSSATSHRNSRDPVDRLVGEPSMDFRLRRALEYARCNLQHDLSLTCLATIADLSVWHICRLFKDQLGVSPARYVKLLRMKCAADLLANTSLRVKEVMTSVGINDASHFARDFRTFSGEFPVAYRMRLQKRVTTRI